VGLTLAVSGSGSGSLTLSLSVPEYNSGLGDAKKAVSQKL